jgi:site-specific recombinase XerD
MVDLLLDEATEKFLRGLGASPHTYKTYSTGLKAFLEFLAEKSDSPNPTVSSIGEEALEEFFLWLDKKGFSRFTEQTYLAAATAFLRYLFRHHFLPEDFSIERAKEKLRAIIPRGSYPIPMPDPDLPQIVIFYDQQPLPQDRLERLRLLRSRAIVHTLYASAGRIAEIASLNRKDVADGRRREVVVTGKGQKQRFIFLTPEAQEAIRAYIEERQDDYEPLFISHGRDYGSRLSSVSIWATVKKAAKALGLHVTPHDFRHYRATQMLEEGAPLEAIQDILGHADISTTKRVYAHYSKPHIREIFDRTTLPPEEAIKKRRP